MKPRLLVEGYTTRNTKIGGAYESRNAKSGKFMEVRPDSGSFADSRKEPLPKPPKALSSVQSPKRP